MDEAKYKSGQSCIRDNCKMNNQAPGRRKFFTSLTGWIASLADEIRGIPQMDLKSLDKVPDEIIGEMIPVIANDGTYRIDEGRIKKYNKSSGEYSDFIVTTRHQMFIIRSFNGISTISDISLKYAERYMLGIEEAFQHVKSLFIELAEGKVCHPKDAYLPQE